MISLVFLWSISLRPLSRLLPQFVAQTNTPLIGSNIQKISFHLNAMSFYPALHSALVMIMNSGEQNKARA